MWNELYKALGGSSGSTMYDVWWIALGDLFESASVEAEDEVEFDRLLILQASSRSLQCIRCLS